MDRLHRSMSGGRRRLHPTRWVFGAVAVLNSVALWSAGVPPGLLSRTSVDRSIPVVALPAVDHEALLAEDAAKPTGPAAGPTRFAVDQAANISSFRDGRWDILADGWHRWQVEIHSPGALSLNLRFDVFDLPGNARLWLYDPEGRLVQGPFTPEDRDEEGGLSTPIVLGDRVIVELTAPPGTDAAARLSISRINHGYRIFGETSEQAKQGSCNIDVICPEGDAWRNQIRAVARYTIDGIYLCTGTLVNNTAEDDRPLFLTADHCDVRASNDHTMIVYWNYESAACGDLSGGRLNRYQTGATFLSTWEWNWSGGSDFTLVELDTQPDPQNNVYYAGWDVTGNTPQSSVCIHHPSGDEKAISFDSDPLSTRGASHWKVIDWNLGTTEPGSSGSCLFDESNGLCIGTLSGGYAACGNDDEDWYGQMHESWTGGGTSNSRLSDHLDPLGLGVNQLQGKAPEGAGETTQWLIPAAASTPGYGASNWKTQIAVTNPTASSITATLYFVASDTSWPGQPLTNLRTIPAKGTLYLDDPLANLYPVSGLMAVTVSSPEAVVSTRTYNLETDGSTFGQGIPGIPLTSVEASDSVVLPLIHSEPDVFHTNVGIVQTSAGSLLARITIRDESGSVVATKVYSQTAAFRQINTILTNMGVAWIALEGGWIEVERIGGSPTFWTAYASVVDDRTGDPTYIGPIFR